MAKVGARKREAERKKEGKRERSVLATDEMRRFARAVTKQPALLRLQKDKKIKIK